MANINHLKITKSIVIHSTGKYHGIVKTKVISTVWKLLTDHHRFHILEVALLDNWSEDMRWFRSFHVMPEETAFSWWWPAPDRPELRVVEEASSSVFDEWLPLSKATLSTPAAAKIFSTVSPVILAADRCLSLLLLIGLEAPRVSILLCFLSVITWSRLCSRAFKVSLRMGILLPPKMGVSENGVMVF